jgi:hypothetical protein
MRYLLRLTISLMALYTTACSVDSKVTDSREPDFLNSKVISSTQAYADGQSDLVVTIQLLNSDGSPVVGHELSSDLSQSGDGVFAIGCSKSDDKGFVVCRYRAVEWGQRRVDFANIKNFPLNTSVEFLEPPGRFGNITGLTSVSAQKKITSGGYKVSFSMDPLVSRPVQTTTSGYVMKLSVQSVLDED